MTWALIADSSCNLREYRPTAPDCIYAVAPLKIEVAGEEFIDDASLDVEELNRRVAAESTASGSACPSAGEWADLFRGADNVIAVTISPISRVALTPPRWGATSSWTSTPASTMDR